MTVPGDLHLSGPRALRDAELRTDRLRRRFEPHVAPLNNLVEALRARHGPWAVPWFDPADGGTAARILWLLEAPGPKATELRGGSGFVSCDNDDCTAENTWRTREEAGVHRKVVVHWNVIPYYLGDERRIRVAAEDDITGAGPLMTEMLGRLPHLRCVILGGATAERAWDQHAPGNGSLRIIRTKHPSPRNLNSRPHYRAHIVTAWREAATTTGRVVLGSNSPGA